MITIYSKSTIDFTSNGYGVLKDFLSNPLITEVLNGEYYLELEYARDGWLSEYLINENIIKANGQPFRIYNVEQTLKSIKILARHIVFDLDNNFLEDVYPQDLNGINALQWILDNLKETHNFTCFSDVETIASARYIRKNFMEALIKEDNSVLNKWGGELEFDNFEINLHNQRGENRGLSIRYGKNLTGLTAKFDFSTVVTRIMPYGNNALLIPDKYVDSPLISNYAMPRVKKIDYNVGVDENTTEEEAISQLIYLANKDFQNGIDLPTVSVKVDFLELAKVDEYKNYSNLESVYLGDLVNVYVEPLNINLSIKVIKTVYDCLKERFIKIELGKVMPNYVNSQQTMMKNAINATMPSTLQQAKIEATDLLRQPFSGYIYFDESGNMYIMDTDDIATAQSVWKWGLGGLGYSSTGINGTFNVAITQDGKIVADFVTAGTMSTSRIEGLNDTLDGLGTSIAIMGDSILTTVSQSGGNNLLINPIGLQDNGVTTNAYGWTGVCKAYTDTSIQRDYLGKSVIRLMNGTRSQIVQTPNGEYTLSFLYQKLIHLADCSLEINGHVIELTAETKTRGSYTFTVTNSQIEVKLISDTDDSCNFGENMLVSGTVSQVYSSNATEVITDNVKIGNGVEVRSSNKNFYTRMDADGNRTFNATTNEVVNESTDKGTKSKLVESQEGIIGGFQIKQIGNQSCLM